MPTRGPKSGGPEDPTQKPSGPKDSTQLDNLMSRITKLEIDNLTKAATSPFNSPNLMGMSDLVPGDIPGGSLPDQPKQTRFPRTPSLLGSRIPASPVPPNNPPNPPKGSDDLRFYSGQPERIADISSNVDSSSRANAFVRANRYSQSALKKAEMLSEGLSGTQFESLGKRAVEFASKSHLDTERSQEYQRETNRIKPWKEFKKANEKYVKAESVHNRYKGTKFENQAKRSLDIARANRNNALNFARDRKKTGQRLRDTSRESSKRTQKSLRDIAQKAIVTGGINNRHTKNFMEHKDRNGTKESSCECFEAAANKICEAISRLSRGNKSGGQKRVNSVNRLLGRNKFKEGQANFVDNVRASQKAKREARRIEQAKRMQKLKNLAKIGIGSAIAHKAASGDFMGAARGVAWASGNPAAIIGTELVSAALTAAKALSHFSEQTFEANKYLANYSGKLAYAYGTLELHEWQRTFKYSAGVTDTSADLVESMDKMRDQWMKYNIASGNIANTVASLWTRASGGFGESLGKETAVFAEVVRRFSGMKIGGVGVGDVASTAGSAAAEAGIGTLWGMFPGGTAARAAIGLLFKPAPTPDPGDTPVVTFLKGMRDRRERITPALRDMERPEWKGGLR